MKTGNNVSLANNSGQANLSNKAWVKYLNVLNNTSIDSENTDLQQTLPYSIYQKNNNPHDLFGSSREQRFVTGVSRQSYLDFKMNEPVPYLMKHGQNNLDCWMSQANIISNGNFL